MSEEFKKGMGFCALKDSRCMTNCRFYEEKGCLIVQFLKRFNKVVQLEEGSK